MDNITGLLASEGLSCGDIVKVTIFMTDLEDVMAMNEVYSSYVSEPYPARSTIGVSFLAIPNGRVEIEAIAIWP
jgi:2-iminobutanoate/2-iminopropanoate deaminase